MPLVAREPSLSSSSFMGARPRICGKMIARWSMRSRRERAESKATHQCLHCTLWVNTGPSLLYKLLCSPLKNFSRSWTTSGWWQTLVAAIYAELESALCDHAGIRINLGKTQLFNRRGFLPPSLPTHPPSGQGDDSSRDRVAWRPHAPK